MNPSPIDLVVVGGGIVGLAAAREILQRTPGLRVRVLEKEPQLAAHQTTHNSGVIHSGVYYTPGSLKASLCVEGAKLLEAFCAQHRIPVLRCGKVIVAASVQELPRLEALFQRGQANRVPGLALIGPERLREIEPQASGLRALHVPSTAAVDFSAVARALAQEVQQQGGEIVTAARVTRLLRRSGGWMVESTAGATPARALLTCGGLHADRLAAMAGARPAVRIVPFRGEYYELTPQRRALVRGMIYPVPDPALPFLGAHLTRGVDGTVHAGPNAILALKREGYRPLSFALRDALELAQFPGTWRMAQRYWSAGLVEWRRSISRAAFARALQRLVPQLCAADLVPAEAGVRAQAVDRAGRLVDDFAVVQAPAAVHVLNVPSPAATASLAIGRMIADMTVPLYA